MTFSRKMAFLMKLAYYLFICNKID